MLSISVLGVVVAVRISNGTGSTNVATVVEVHFILGEGVSV